MPTPPSLDANDGREFGTLYNARRRSEVLASITYLGASLALLSYFRFRFYWILGSWSDNRCEIAALVGGVLLLVSSIRVFMARKFGDLLALAGALLVWPYFRLTEFNRYTFSLWLIFNLPDGSYGRHSAFLIAGLTIVSICALVAATAYSVIRLTPRAWFIGKLPLRDRGWPGFAICFVFLVTWYLTAATPYQIPIFDIHQMPPAVSILHVEKHGLQFHETRLDFYRDGRFYFARDDRRLFQYRFQRSVDEGVLTEEYFRLLTRIASSPPEFRGSHVSSHVPRRSWNADRWLVVIEGRGERKPIDVGVPDAPKEVLALFYGAQKILPGEMRQEIARDVCFGFCYDPAY